MALTMNASVPPYSELSMLYPDFVSCKKETEVSVEDACIRIDQYSGSKTSINILVSYYKDNQAATPFHQKQYTFTPSVADGSTNFIKQGYVYLKTLPAFSAAVDS